MAVLTTSGRAALAKAIKARQLHLAWGNEIVRNHAGRRAQAATPDTRQVALEPKVAVGGTERVAMPGYDPICLNGNPAAPAEHPGRPAEAVRARSALDRRERCD